MLKAIVEKLEDVTESDRGHYKPLEGGGFFVEVAGLEEGTKHPTVGALARAKAHEAAAATAKAAEAAKLKTELDSVRAEMHKRLQGKVEESDLEALDSSYRQKLAELEAVGKAREVALSTSLREVLVDREARTIAFAPGFAVDTGAAELLAEHIQRRLTVELTSEGKAVTRVLGSDGKPSAASLEDLRKEIVVTPKYHALLLGSRASGSGATSGGAAGGASSAGTKIDLSKRNPKEYAAEIASRL